MISVPRLMSGVAPSLRLRVLAARVARRIRSVIPGPRTVYVGERVAEYRGYWSEAAQLLGATFEELAPGVWEVRRGNQRTRLVNFVTQCDDPVILHLAGDKPFGYQVAAAAGVPVPEHRVITLAELGEAVRFLEQTDVPLVVKPAAGSSSGLGVSVGVQGQGQLAAAAALASLYDQRILVEKMVPGESYRILYLAGSPIHAVRRRGIRITGDGQHSVSHLLSPLGSRDSEPMVRRSLQAQGVTPAKVLPHGKQIVVGGIPGAKRTTRELRTVYDEAVLELCSPELLQAGAAVVRTLGSELAGVDVITPDPTVSLGASCGAFIEINTTPGIHHHYVPGNVPTTTPVAVTVLDYLLTRNVNGTRPRP